MQEFLKIYSDYRGSNPKLKTFAVKLSLGIDDCDDDYNDMFELLEEELEEQVVDNMMYESDTNQHKLCQNELI